MAHIYRTPQIPRRHIQGQIQIIVRLHVIGTVLAETAFQNIDIFAVALQRTLQLRHFYSIECKQVAVYRSVKQGLFFRTA